MRLEIATYDDSTSLSANSRSRSFLIFGESFAVLLFFLPSTLLRGRTVDVEETFDELCLLIKVDVVLELLPEGIDDELTDICSCSPGLFDSELCLLVTFTWELCVDCLPIVTSSWTDFPNPDLPSDFVAGAIIGWLTLDSKDGPPM